MLISADKVPTRFKKSVEQKPFGKLSSRLYDTFPDDSDHFFDGHLAIRLDPFGNHTQKSLQKENHDEGLFRIRYAEPGKDWPENLTKPICVHFLSTHKIMLVIHKAEELSVIPNKGQVGNQVLALKFKML